MVVQAIQLRVGMLVKFKGEICSVYHTEHRTPGLFPEEGDRDAPAESASESEGEREGERGREGGGTRQEEGGDP